MRRPAHTAWTKRGTLKTIPIRELSGEVIKAATDQGRALGVTKGGALVGVLIPTTGRLVELLSVAERSRILEDAENAELELAAERSITTLAEVLQGGRRDSGGSTAAIPRVGIRELSGKRIDDAAAARQPLAVTHEKNLVAFLLPVTPRWVQQLVAQNLTQVVTEAERAESGILDRDVMTLDDVLSLAPGSAGSRSTAASRGAIAARRPPAVGGPHAIHERRVAGVQIVVDSGHASECLIGVVTDLDANILHGPVVAALARPDQDNIVAELADFIAGLESSLDPRAEYLVGVGLQVGGHVDRGTVVFSPGAQWSRFPLAELLAQKVRLPVVLENDANAFAVRERRLRGGGKGGLAVVLLTHYGVGCGIVLDGQLSSGAAGMAGEIGHIPVEADLNAKAKCRCNNPGCLEVVATPHAIEEHLRSHGGFEGDYFEAVRVADSRDNEVVAPAFTRAGSALGLAISVVMNLLNPAEIVLYGPPELVGTPRSLDLTGEPHDLPGELSDLVGEPRDRHSAVLFTDSLVDAVRKHSFSTAVEDCRLIVKNVAEVDAPLAAASCAIEQIASWAASSRNTMWL
jgi:predicted NBD/HSP70 family sugar kinase